MPPKTRAKRCKENVKLVENKQKIKNKTTIRSNNLNTGKNSSFRLLENKKQDLNAEQDVYEFTFDPAEEPPPQKKKKKRAVKKKMEKPKMVNFKSNYDQKMAKSLEVLKNMVSNNNTKKQPNILLIDGNKKIQEAKKLCSKNDNSLGKGKQSSKTINNLNQNIHNPKTNQVNNHVSVRIEDIAAQFEPTPVHNELDYSPVNSPIRPLTILENVSNREPSDGPINNDPLNLLDDLSFFDDQPVANSSMNTSKHPTASPWRVEYNNLPIKWKVNTYVKPNMTPAFECSYIENSTKKQVYTNILSESHNLVPETECNNKNLKQTSVISFTKDTVNKSLNEVAVTPTKQNSLFEESLNVLPGQRGSSPMNFDGPTSDLTKHDSRNSNKSTDNKKCDDITTRSRKRQIEDPIKVSKNKRSQQDNNNTLFGFDDSETVDQENVSPEIIDKRRRNLRPKSRTVLQELNELAGPTRAVVPAKAKLGTNSEVVNRIYEELKSAAPAPLFPEKDADKNQQITNLNLDSDCDSDSNSVHLFEDIELVHHLKTIRKSYGKPKKVTFRQGSSSDSDDRPPQAELDDSYDDLSDLTFQMPAAEKKKTGKKKMTKKQKIIKKEEKEAEKWAAQFNSMCEDVEEFDLVVE